MMMLSGEWLAPCQARSIRSPPISSVRRSSNVSSFGGRAGSSSRSSRRRVSSCPMRATFLSNRNDAPPWSAGRLLGRQRERAVLERLLDTAREGHGAVLVVYGEPGVGKTALLEYAVESGEDFRIVRTVGAEGEMELDYAALQQLCSPILEFS